MENTKSRIAVRPKDKAPKMERKTFLYSLTKPLAWWIAYGLFTLKIIKGKDNMPKDGACIAAGNHIHFADPIICAFSQKRQIRFMAKAELFGNFITRGLCRGYGAFPVLRGCSDLASLRTSLGILKEGKVLGIFPEGTRSKTGEIGRGKAGIAMLAYRSQAPIYPFAVYAKRKPFTLFCGYTVAFGEPVTAADLGIVTGSAKEYRDGTRKLMEIIHALYEECKEARE